MTLNDVVFVDSLPTLDLHGYTRDIAIIAIKDYIRDNLKIKNEIFLIIHGKGSGILKEATVETLKQNRNVLEYKSNYYNSGATMVRIKI